MTQPIEVFHIFGIALYQYYLSYKRLPLTIDRELCQSFTAYLIHEFTQQFDYIDLYHPDEMLDSFMLFEKPFDEHISIESLENPFSYIADQLIQFPMKHFYEIHDAYRILSIIPIPFDSFDITHGMVLKFFTCNLDKSL